LLQIKLNMIITYKRDHEKFSIDFENKSFIFFMKMKDGSWGSGSVQYWDKFPLIRDLLSAESTPINMGNYYAQPIVAESDEDKANHIALFTSNPEIFRV